MEIVVENIKTGFDEVIDVEGEETVGSLKEKILSHSTTSTAPADGDETPAKLTVDDVTLSMDSAQRRLLGDNSAPIRSTELSSGDRLFYRLSQGIRPWVSPANYRTVSSVKNLTVSACGRYAAMSTPPTHENPTTPITIMDLSSSSVIGHISGTHVHMDITQRHIAYCHAGEWIVTLKEHLTGEEQVFDCLAPVCRVCLGCDELLVVGTTESVLVVSLLNGGTAVLDIPGAGFSSIAVSPCLEMLALLTLSAPQIASLPSGRKLRDLALPKVYTQKPVFSPDSQLLACPSGVLGTTLWSVETGKVTHYLKGHTDTVSSVCFTACSKYVLTSGWDAKVIVRRVDTAAQVHVFRHDASVFTCVVSKDSKYLVTEEKYTVTVGKMIKLPPQK